MDTRKSLEDEVLAWLDESGDTSTTRTNVRNALRAAHNQRLTETDWPFLLWHEPKRIDVVVGQRVYALHPEYHRPLYFRSATRNAPLRELPFAHYKPSVEERDRYVLWNRSPVAMQPSAASQLTIVSSEAGDSGSQKVRVRGETVYGMASEVISADGTNPVTGTVEFLTITQMSKIGSWAGRMTMTSNGGAVTNVVLMPDEPSRSHQTLKLLWEPTETETIEYQFYRTPNPLEEDDSVPDIPYPHSSILVWDTLKLLMSYDGQLDAARLATIEKEIEKRDLAMRQTFLEGQSLDAIAPSVHDIEDE